MEDDTAIRKSNRGDLAFGSQLLGDYARFLCDAICYRFKTEIGRCQGFIKTFDDLYAKFVKETAGGEMAALNAQVYADMQAFRKYILDILRKQIAQEIIVYLNPQYLNMVVNSTELLLDGLASYMRGEYPDTTKLTSTWLENMFITVLTIENRIGDLYFEQKTKAEEFAELFLKLHMKSQTLDGMRRTGLKGFPALTEFYDEIQRAMADYAGFLIDLIRLISEQKYTGMLTLLEVDSIYRRACFFMTKLSKISTIAAPVCDPASPRMK